MDHWIRYNRGALILTALMLFLLGGGFWLIRERSNLANLARVPSALYAKEMCSCVFVTGREESFCDAYVRPSIPFRRVSVDRVRGAVDASVLVRSARAKYISKRAGCALE